MNVLVLSSNYPYTANPISGIFNEKTVDVLVNQGQAVEVLSPRPYTPDVLAKFVARWSAYREINPYEVRKGVKVRRPAYPQVPGLLAPICVDYPAFLFSRRLVSKLHQVTPFDAVLGFDLIGSAVMAWRLGHFLGVPVAGWFTGRIPSSLLHRHNIRQALKKLDVVFYQSREILDSAAKLLGVSADLLLQNNHIVLPRGITEPPSQANGRLRDQTRARLGIRDDQCVVLNIGRISADKGIFELLDAVSLAAVALPNIVSIIVGSNTGFDESNAVQKKIDNDPRLKKIARLFPMCNSDQVWEYLCAADIFAFASHHEGMPNSLLEAMAIGVPTIAFAIPPVLEIEAGLGAPYLVPPFDSSLFSQAIQHLAASRQDRARIADIGKKRICERFLMKANMSKACRKLSQVVETSRMRVTEQIASVRE